MRECAIVVGFALVVGAGYAPTPEPLQGASSKQTVEVGDPPTIWDGVYTTEQAARGERTAWANCFTCHSESEWSSPLLLNIGSGQRLGDLYNVIRQSMPLDAPGRLSSDQYVDVIAYMLKLLDAPTGEAELPPDLAELDRIRVTAP